VDNIKLDTGELYYVYIISPSDEYDCVFNGSGFVLAMYLNYITGQDTIENNLNSA